MKNNLEKLGNAKEINVFMLKEAISILPDDTKIFIQNKNSSESEQVEVIMTVGCEGKYHLILK